MITYKAFELHTHTLHSDGSFTVEELCRAAKERQYDGIAMTDHNTFSGAQELTPELERETLPVAKGIEWTTFFGHMVVIGADRYVDWRFARPEDIDDSLQKIQGANGVAGLAHPFAVGSPMCTGCHWMFHVKNWSLVQYIEVFSRPDPVLQPENERSYKLWTSLLNAGHRLAATSGRDWHGPDPAGKCLHAAATYLGIEGPINTVAVREALRAGRTYVTAGPAMSVNIETNQGSYDIGDTVRAGRAVLRVQVDESARRQVWESFGISVREVRAVVNGAVAQQADYTGGSIELNLDLQPGWLRVELMGDCQGKNGRRLAFSSPVYVTGRPGERE